MGIWRRTLSIRRYTPPCDGSWQTRASASGHLRCCRMSLLRSKTLSLWLLVGGLLGMAVTLQSQIRRDGVFDDYNDLRGDNPTGTLQWGMGGVRAAMESLSGSLMFAPAGMAWSTPPFISGEFDIRTYYPRGNNNLAAESQTLFVPRWIGTMFAYKSWRFGLGYGVPYGHRRVYQISGAEYEFTLAENRIVAPVAVRIGNQWAAGVTLGLSFVSWKERLDGSETGNSANGLGFASAIHVQWRPRADLTFGIEAEPPVTISGDAKFNSVTFPNEEWKRPLGLRAGVQKQWSGFRAAGDLYFNQYSALDNWMVDRGLMSHDQWGAAAGIEISYAGAKWRLGGQAETDPVYNGEVLAVMISAGSGWSLGGVDVNAALVDSHLSSDSSQRATRFLFGVEILTPASAED